MSGFTDIQTGGWLARLPGKGADYAKLMRLDRPIGTWLLLLPGWWGIALAGFDPWLFVLFGVGAVVMRGAGCVVNDMWDRDFDRAVERTRGRPLASGALSMRQAFGLLFVLLLIGLVILLQLPVFAIGLGAASLVLVATYPLMKRVTWWPQAFLGFTFNWGVLLGYAAATGHLAAPAITFYAAGVLWTLAYDTIYAHQDKADDALVGVKSTARKLGAQSRAWVAGFFAGALGLMLLAGAAAGFGWVFYAAMALPAAHAIWQIRRWQLDDPANCLKLFRSNRDFGLLVLGAILCGHYL